ncbi:hypothetical protein GY45DRAFT_292544 [Cubamyces sp. BRFM 1775]|nr:hypothetical protein GY45DRAFT_292544 [Cubamyces sp. BRFM 1775]
MWEMGSHAGELERSLDGWKAGRLDGRTWTVRTRRPACGLTCWFAACASREGGMRRGRASRRERRQNTATREDNARQDKTRNAHGPLMLMPMPCTDTPPGTMYRSCMLYGVTLQALSSSTLHLLYHRHPCHTRLFLNHRPFALSNATLYTYVSLPPAQPTQQAHVSFFLSQPSSNAPHCCYRSSFLFRNVSPPLYLLPPVYSLIST